MLPPAAPPQPAPRRRLATPDAPVASAAPTAPPCPAALKACTMSTTCEHARSPEVAAPRAPLVGLAAWLWSVPEDARAHLHDALHAVAALMGEQQAAATQAEARAEQIQEEHSPPEKDRLSQAVSQAVSQAMSRAVSQAVALLGAHEQERKECCKGVEVPVPPKALETLLLATERCPGLQSVSPWSSKSIVNLDNAILTLATPSLSVKRLHENRPECPSVRPSAPLSLVAQDSTAALAAAPRAGPVRHQSLSPNPPAEALGLRASPPSLVVSRHSSGHSGWNSQEEVRSNSMTINTTQKGPHFGLYSSPHLASGILGDESNTVEDSTAGSVGTIARVSSRPSRHIGVLAVPGADESIAIVPKGPLELDRVVLVSESPCTSTGLVITEQVDSQDEVLEALLDRLPSVGSAALVAMATEGMATALVDEDVDESGSGAVVEREDNVVEDPPTITCESVNSEVSPAQLESTPLPAWRTALLEKELERRLMKMLDRTQARVHDQLVPTARKFACSVSYWMETYLLRAEDKLAARQ
ncbi:uncharacterized protein LOC113201721 [Frankliniella occidentalis]|uniref:Uncharacterized protein LOC113201721 n=1 Tax=Frankliniella occidentalis TaxID=133901 RepID=A0A9C6UC30_FRAOC|nr:uncharacterized protein LOC113201721 [Frankliniella occidentalis]